MLIGPNCRPSTLTPRLVGLSSRNSWANPFLWRTSLWSNRPCCLAIGALCQIRPRCLMVSERFCRRSVEQLVDWGLLKSFEEANRAGEPQKDGQPKIVAALMGLGMPFWDPGERVLTCTEYNPETNRSDIPPRYPLPHQSNITNLARCARDRC